MRGFDSCRAHGHPSAAVGSLEIELPCQLNGPCRLRIAARIYRLIDGVDDSEHLRSASEVTARIGEVGVVERIVGLPGLSRCAAPRELLRRRYQQATGVSDQQLHAARADHRANLQAALAGRAFLSLDQDALAYQGVLRNQRERGEDPDMDRRKHIRPGRHRPQTARPGGEPLPNPTDSKPRAAPQ